MATELPTEITRVKQRFGIVGSSPALMQAIERALKVAPIDLTVLVTGESGAGKEFFPQIIHAGGARKHSKYIAVNCGAIPEGTIDSELFGHEKGSFTGAIATRKGYFEEADGGTIFLDEVAELPLTTQARLLRVLETGEFLKVGSSQVQTANVRVVAATNVDLLKAVAEGRFREDLYYRLSTVQISVPALHDRGGDVMLLARKFAADFAEKYMMPAVTFTDDARRLMMLYRWPGNVRQLKNVIEQAALYHAGEQVDQYVLKSYLPKPKGSTELAKVPAKPSYEDERDKLWSYIVTLQNQIQDLRERISANTLLSETVPDTSHALVATRDEAEFTPYSPVTEAVSTEAAPTEAERDAIADALRRADGNRARAAEILGISTRTLYRRIKDYDLD